ncbi:MAG: hypothetical protein O7B99_10770 [Planctomycetota bacterium]|nr:hypothetical protein [Planctomycetota bacterium]
MKKLLAFVLLFGAGFMILRLVQDPTAEGLFEGGEEEGPDWIPNNVIDVDGFTPGGRLEHSQNVESEGNVRPVRVETTAERSGRDREQPDIFYLEEVVIEYLDPETRRVRTRVTAARARVRERPSDELFTLELEPRFALTDAVVEIFEGAPIVPLTVRFRTLEIDTVARTLRSSDPVTIEGDDLEASGVGFVVEETRGRMTFLSEGRIDFVRREEVDEETREITATLVSKGALRVRREPGDGEARLAIEAHDGASLTPGSPAGAGLEAERIVIRARGHEGEEPLVIETVEADGNVVYRHAGNVFRGRTARVTFLSTGEPLSARIEGEPVAQIAVGDVGERPQGAQEEDPAVLTIEGVGPLVMDWGADGMGFRMGGPAVVRGFDSELRCNDEIHGSTRAKGATFEASGEVFLEHGDALLRTDLVVVVVAILADGTRTLSATAQGESVLTGVAKGDRDFLLTSTGKLIFRLVDDTWTVPEAEMVELNLRGEEGFRASADLVTNFDPEHFALEARGNVELESAEGLGRGGTLVVRGRDSFVLTGTPERRASYEGPEGRAVALRMERTGERFQARGAIEASVRPAVDAPETYVLVCEYLDIDRRTAGMRREFNLDARGSVTATVSFPDQSFEIPCERLVAHRIEERTAEDEILRVTTKLDAEGVSDAVVTRTDLDLKLSTDRLQTDRVEGPEGEVLEGVARAIGRVRFHGTLTGVPSEEAPEDEAPSKLPFNGVGDFFEIDHEGNGSLRAAEGERVFFSGVLPANGRPFEMEARWIEFSSEHIEASGPDIQVLGMGREGQSIDIRARARHLLSTKTQLELEEDVHIEGLIAGRSPWLLEADHVRFEGQVGSDAGGGEVSAMLARGDVRLEVPERGMTAVGDELQARTLAGVMRLVGKPARIETYLRMTEADWVEFDVNLGAVTSTGRARFGDKAPPDEESCTEGMQDHADQQGDHEEGFIGWSLECLSSRTLVDADALVFILQEPVLHYPEQDLFPFLPAEDLTLRASWAVIWINRSKWQELGGPLAGGDIGALLQDDESDVEEASGHFARLRATPLGKMMNEIYLEGPVEASFHRAPQVRADAMYLDIVSGHGWITKADFRIKGEFLGQSFDTLQVQADWMRLSEDGSFQAQDATIALCEFDEPHVRIATGDFRIIPRGRLQGDQRYRFELTDNRVELYNWIVLPLPPLKFSTDEEYKPDWASVEIGDSARYGSFASAGIVRPAGRVGEVFNDFLGGHSFDFDGEVSARASYLSSRGALLDLGLSLESKPLYWWDMQLGGIYDTGEDRGYIRVEPDDRSDLRLWYRTHGRYRLGEGHWIDLAGSAQTDAAVQSEFYEREFERYEQTENYVHWRLADDEYYFDASAKKRVNGFRTDVEELPSVGVFRGRSPIMRLGSVPIVYSGGARAEYLQRREGDPDLASPFGPVTPIADGLGDREVMRFDSSHRLEAPISLGWMGLRATPFVLARATAWSDDVAEDDSPSRFLGQVGLRVSTVLWKNAGEGKRHQVSPFVEMRGDFVLEESGGPVVVFDEVEESVEGNFVDVGLRTRFYTSGNGSVLDADVRGTHASSVPSGEPDGWREIAVFARYSTTALSLPLQVFQDGRYDLEKGDTLYSRSTVGLQVTGDLGFQASHLRGRDIDGEALYEAVSAAALYTLTEKWEIEGRRSISLRDDDPLGANGVLRRYGHDMIFEFEVSFRQGEGGNSISISVRPAFNFDRPEVGRLDL